MRPRTRKIRTRRDALGGWLLVGGAALALAAEVAWGSLSYLEFVRHHRRTACRINLNLIAAAKEGWTAEHRLGEEQSVSLADLVRPKDGSRPWLLQEPVCTAGGLYVPGRSGEPPRCTAPGHRWEWPVLTGEF